MALDDAELPVMLEVLGEPVTLGATTTQGIVDRTRAEIGPPGDFPELTSGSVVVHVRTGSLPGLASGSTVHIGSVDYIVREQLQIDDGSMTRLECVVLA